MRGILRTLAAGLVLAFIGMLPALWSSRAQAAQAVLCGGTVSFELSGVASNAPALVGVWSGGTWNANTCGALIVQRADRDRADVIYIYGPSGPHSRMPWNSLRTSALLMGNELTFRDNQGGNFLFRLDGRTLAGFFTDSRGHSLQAALGKEGMGAPSEPQLSGLRPNLVPLPSATAPPIPAALPEPTVDKPPEVEQREGSLVSQARKENKPALIKEFLVANPHSPEASHLNKNIWR
jgi:hypothetical protein